MSHINYLNTPSNNASFFWSQALDQSATAPTTDGCTALLDGSGIGHDFGHHIGGGHSNGHGYNGNGYGHNGGPCVPAAGAITLLVVALAVVARRAR